MSTQLQHDKPQSAGKGRMVVKKIISRPTPQVGQTEDRTVTNNGTRKFQPYNKHMEPQEGARAPDQTVIGDVKQRGSIATKLGYQRHVKFIV